MNAISPPGAFDIDGCNQAARFLSCSPTTLRKWIRKGLITSYRLGGKFKFRSDELIGNLKNQSDGRI